MPTFDFKCKKCETVFEHSRPFGSKEHPACPECRSKRTEKLLTPPAIHFKGGGFYKTDSRAPAPKSSPSKVEGGEKKEKPIEKPKEEKKEAPKAAPPARSDTSDVPPAANPKKE